MPDMFRPCSYLPLASPGLDGVVFHVKLAASPHRASTETRAPPLLTRVIASRGSSWSMGAECLEEKHRPCVPRATIPAPAAAEGQTRSAPEGRVESHD